MGALVLEAATAAKFLARLAVQARGRKAWGKAMVDSSCTLNSLAQQCEPS